MIVARWYPDLGQIASLRRDIRFGGRFKARAIAGLKGRQHWKKVIWATRQPSFLSENPVNDGCPCDPLGIVELGRRGSSNESDFLTSPLQHSHLPDRPGNH